VCDKTRVKALLWLGLGFLGATAQTAAAQAYPAKQIRYVVPQAAGGSSDTLARVLAPRLGEALGQQVVVDNRAGATGIIGSEIVARAPPDGYTIIQVSTSLATNPAMGVKLPYDTVRDFSPITLLSQQPNLWVVHPSLPAQNMRELIALARARPGQIDFSSSGTGGSQHLAGELLNVMARVKLVHIPYKGSPQALIDVLAGRVPVMSSTMAPAMPHVKSGRLRALAVTSTRRSPAAPEVPTVAESGLPGYEAIAWQGVLAPAGTPDEIITRLNAALVNALKLDGPRRQLAEQGYEPVGTSARGFAEYIPLEIAKWSRVIKSAGIRPE
jgi:tripartite-type tricarboxylate transporter receptor subunit TctC